MAKNLPKTSGRINTANKSPQGSDSKVAPKSSSDSLRVAGSESSGKFEKKDFRPIPTNSGGPRKK